VYLLDQVAQYRAPFVVVSDHSGERWHLSGAAEAAADVRKCPTRYVLSDELTTLCTDLAYSKGARVFGCMDLMRIPARRLWIEWAYNPWLTRMTEYGFKGDSSRSAGGRHGILLQASADGLRGSMRSFWSFGPLQSEVYASSVVSHFRLDGPLDRHSPICANGLRVSDADADPDNILPQCFHFELEKTWADYYSSTVTDGEQRRRILSLAVATLAPAVPFVLAFLLLLLSRQGLPLTSSRLEHLNALRSSRGKQPLLDHIEVRAPLFASSPTVSQPELALRIRRGPRLHHVRGHLVRRANQLFWRVPHLRGSAKHGVVQSRTVTWMVDGASV
jgi:hypothetical protein